ncbi:D-lactate dehydrogenase [Salmonella enterica subsp. enterica]|nr:D-lactate dehydrogenase [Salmonella enterica subsp. enterica]
MSSITMTDNKTFLNELARLVGHSHLLTDPAKNRPLSQGFPFRSGRRAGRCFPGFITGTVACAQRLR